MFRSSKFLSLPVLCFLSMSAGGADAVKTDAYVPGLGEIMSATQMRHTKLWFAGRARNWPLAAYELDELREGFDDAVKYHPVHKDATVPISKILPEIMDKPLKVLDNAIKTKDEEKFTHAYDTLTAACNSCHQEENFGFNIIQRPASNPYTDQAFSPVNPAPLHK